MGDPADSVTVILAFQVGGCHLWSLHGLFQVKYEESMTGGYKMCKWVVKKKLSDREFEDRMTLLNKYERCRLKSFILVCGSSFWMVNHSRSFGRQNLLGASDFD